MKVDIITLFPKMFEGPFAESIVQRAQDKELVEINIHNLRKWTNDKRKTVDDKPFGGGVGMVMKVEPIYKAIKELTPAFNCPPDKGGLRGVKQPTVILMTPQGGKLEQQLSNKLSTHSHLILLCGHYEGVDERIRANLIDLEISIGDYVLTGGELPAMVLVDSIVRLIPGVVGKQESVQTESFQTINGEKLLEYPQYTQPAKFTTDDGEVWTVPEVLTSGHHQNIENWRHEQALKRTEERRPELLGGSKQ